MDKEGVGPASYSKAEFVVKQPSWVDLDSIMGIHPIQGRMQQAIVDALPKSLRRHMAVMLPHSPPPSCNAIASTPEHIANQCLCSGPVPLGKMLHERDQTKALTCHPFCVDTGCGCVVVVPLSWMHCHAYSDPRKRVCQPGCTAVYSSCTLRGNTVVELAWFSSKCSWGTLN